jgi:putative SOS response-associated peptidase YedK
VCGRYALHADAERLVRIFELSQLPRDLVPRYNVAPTQQVAVVRAVPGGGRELVGMRWGLVPSWSDGPGTGPPMINARAETARDRPAFRSALTRRRCLVPADGFYEWKRLGRRSLPHYVHPPGDGPFALAGLWERWEKAGKAVLSCTILTTAPNAAVAPIHDRMPVVLAPRDFALWLDPAVPDPEAVGPLLVPCPPEWTVVEPVGPAVNDPRREGPELIRPLP